MDTTKIIQVGGLAFKDLNGNGKLDLYEDWRQPVEDRASALAEMMSAEECIKLMWHGGTRGEGSDPFGGDVNDTSGIDQGSRAGVSRLGTTIESFASDVAWINGIQEQAEASFYGFPYICSTDPYSTLGIPSTIGLAPAMDKDVWRKAGMWIGRAWRASGMSVDLGPQIDLYTNPISARLAGAESEDPALVRDFTQAFGGGMQSTWGDDEATDDLGWGSDSCAIMLKHYVGSGAIETGCDDHNDQGKYNVFPGDNFNASLIGFLDGGMNLDSKTGQMAAVMSNYGIPYSSDGSLGELVAGGYNKHNISILRNAGFDGMVTTDWGILVDGDKTWGVEDLTVAERFKKFMESGQDQIGGDFYPTTGKEGYDLLAAEIGEDVALERVRESARRVATLAMNLTLFENPYSDRTYARQIFESEAAADFAREANEKCVIMLKNSGVLSASGIDGKVYIPQRYTEGSSGMFGSTPATVSMCFGGDLELDWDVVTDTVGEPTGEADENGDATLQASDVVSLTAEELADVSYAIVKVNNPQDAYTGFSGGTTTFGGDSGEPLTYRPVSLQYRPYTADGSYVKQVSIAGDTLEDGTQENRAHYGQSTYATNESDLDLVIDVRSRIPEDAKLILIVDCDKPMVFSEIEPYADAILLGWDGITDEAFASIIKGSVEPSGLLNFQMPASMETVETQLEDVPRDMDCYADSDGNVYDFCFGLNWDGVIDDERTATYKATPLTQPEAEVRADA